MREEVSEARYKFAQAEAKRVWEKVLDRAIPVKMGLLSKALNIPCKKADLSSKVHGYSRMDSDGLCIIIYRENDLITRQKYSVAHEFGHVLLEHIGIGEETKGHDVKAFEQEANCFASALLIPREDLKKFAVGHTITEVATRYEVSREAAYYALEEARLLSKVAEEASPN